MFFYIFFDSSDQIPSFLLRTVSDFFRFQFCSEKQQNEKKYWFFSVSLELRCVLGFWENHPDYLWFWPNFLERNFNLIWTVSDFPIFYRFQFCSKKPKKRSRKIMLFSVSLELRCVFGFWESYPDCLWFVPNFLERSFNLMWTVSDFQSFTDSSFAEVFWQSTLSFFFASDFASIFFKRYETASRKLSKRCLRNPLKTRKGRSRRTKSRNAT